MSLLAAMGVVLLAWAGAAGIALGLGLALDRLLWRDGPGPERGLLAFWTGLAVLLWALLAWSLFAPVTGWTLGLAAAAGAAGLVATRRRWLPLAARLLRAPAWLALLGVGVVALANLSLRAEQHYDTGLYLLGGMQWAREHAVLPGLGALHGRFAFNNAHLLWAALFDAALPGWAPHLLNGALLAGVWAQALLCARRLWVGQGAASAAFGLAALMPAAILARIYAVSLSSDLPATLLALVVAWRTFGLLAGGARGDERREWWVVTLLAAAAVAVKLSTLLLVGGCWLLAGGVVLARAAGSPRSALRQGVAATGLLAALLAPWLARGVVLSGYPLYPSTAISLPVEWRLDPERVRREARAVTAWARVPGVPAELTLEGPYWIESWARRHLRFTLRPSFPLPLALAGLGLLAAALAGSLGRESRAGRGAWLLAPVAVAGFFWFQVAPDPRFGLFVFWAAAGTGAGLAVGAWGPAGARVAVVGMLVLAALSGPHQGVRSLPEGGPAAGPHVATRPFETESGLTLRVPVEGDQCWDAPRPCTPYPRPDLRLRRPGELASGFTRVPTARAGAPQPARPAPPG